MSLPVAPHLKHVWGLTGGIASGKSTAARFFIKNGISVLDADQVSRDLSSPGGLAHAEIVQRLGTGDRAKIREIIFKDPAARQALEAILHPLIRKESFARLSALGPQPVLYEAALLVETGRYQDFAGLIVVEAPWETRIQRLMDRDHSSREHAESILRAQLSDEERRKAATWIIDNSGSLEVLEQRVSDVVKNIRTSH